MLLLYSSCLKSLLWFQTRSLKDGSPWSVWVLVTLYAPISTSARCIKIGVRHWFCHGQFSLVRQLQPYSVVLSLNSHLHYDETFSDILFMLLKLTSTVFLLKIVCNLLDFVKCCFNSFRNVLSIFFFNV